MLPLAKVGSFSESANFLHENFTRRGYFIPLLINEMPHLAPKSYFLPCLSLYFVLTPNEHLDCTFHFE